MAGIYIHIPFCKRKCVYCDFYSTARFDRYGEGFLLAAGREILRQKEFLAGEPVQTLYFGGGTPSLFPAAAIAELTGTVRAQFDVGSGLEEITLEANPEDISPEYLGALSRAGINRISLGVQSFEDELLRFMKRRHDGAKAVEAVRQARQAGFGNISIDLIYGIPGMDAKVWEATLRRALALEPQHISAYHLTIEPRTLMGRWKEAGKISEIPDRQSHEQFIMLHKTLTAAGYEHYEVSNFALPGFRSRHNGSYWDGTPYLGIGPGAHSFNGSVRRWCPMPVEGYVSGETIYETETLTTDDIYNELIMTRLRTAEGILYPQVTRLGSRYAAHFAAGAARSVREGLLMQQGDRYHIPAENFLTSDRVISSLFI